MRIALALLCLLLSVACSCELALGAEADSNNIYATDVARTSTAVQRARDRMGEAELEIARIDLELPGLKASAARLGRVADERSRPAVRALGRADRAERDVLTRRERANERVVETRRAARRDLASWRNERARWIALGATLLALAAAATGAAVLAGRRTRAQGDVDRRLANVAAVTLGFGVAAYLSTLLGALRWADAWIFSWWVVSAASIGVLGAISAVFAGWVATGRISRAQRRLGHTAVPLVAVLAMGGLAPAAFAAADERPTGSALPPEVLRLSAEHRDKAAMAGKALSLRRAAVRLERRATNARNHADSAASVARDLDEDRSTALDDKTRAERTIASQTTKLRTAQADYDRYEALTEAPDEYDESFDDEDPALEDPLDYETAPGLPDVDIPDLAPTTEDFGSGSGSIGLCSDGTMSDSIGRQGACSHHGGVAGGG